MREIRRERERENEREYGGSKRSRWQVREKI